MNGAFRVGEFLIEPQLNTIAGTDKTTRIEPKVMQVLVCLAEGSREVVSKDRLMQSVWPDTFVTDDVLTRAISELRKAFGDEAKEPRFIQTIPRGGYRLIAPVIHDGAKQKEEVGQRESATASPLLPSRVIRMIAGVGAGMVLIVVLALSLRPTAPLPKLSGPIQITNDGQQKIGLVTDGSRLYIAELLDNKSALFQVSVAGGEVIPLPVPFPKPGLDDISPSGSELFVGSYDGPYPFPYWLVPLPGGSPRRLGDIGSHDVHPSPDGRQIAYVVESDLYLARSDGSESRKLLSVTGKIPGNGAWAPDGSKLRFSMRDRTTDSNSIWEVAAAGSNLHPLLPGWNDPAAECCGLWTPNGEYFVFQSTRNGVTHLWAIREKESRWRKALTEPVQLTSGPIQFRSPLPSKDGKKIFAIGDEVRSEIMRYDSKSKEWVPYHSGKSIVWLSFSIDDQWVVYASYPDGTLWRSRVDGSQTQQLTFAPMEVKAPRWSPDGKRIAFQGRTPGKPWKIYTVLSSGGNPEQLMPGDLNEAVPDWSSDGNRLVFGGSPFFDPGTSGPTAIHLIDFRTNEVSVVPSSEGLWAPRWSPDGRYLVAHAFNFDKLMLFDFTTRKWEELATGNLHFANWSRDGRYVYFERWDTGDTSAVRIPISDRKQERIGSLKEFRRTIGPERCWSGLAPDDSLLVLRDIGRQEIYAFDWEAR